MKNYLSKNKYNIICSVSAIVFMWLVWIIAYYSIKNDYIVPSFSDTMIAFWQCLKEGSFWIALFMSLLRTLEAFVISFLLAAGCAALSSVSKIFKSFLKPIMSVLRALPTLAVILLLLIWTNAKVAPIIVTVLVLFPMIYAQFMAAIGDLDNGILEMAEVYKLNKKTKLIKIYLPLISPNILSQTGANVSMGLKIMVSAEVLAITFKSLGGMMQESYVFLQMPRLAALTIVCILLGLLLETGLSLLVLLTRKWRGTGAQND